MYLNKILEEQLIKDYSYFESLDDSIKKNKEAILYLLMLNPNIYYLLDDELAMDLEIISKMVFIKPDIFKNVRKEILLDKNVSKKLFDINPLAKEIYEELGIINQVHISSFPKHILDYLIRIESKNYF